VVVLKSREDSPENRRPPLAPHGEEHLLPLILGQEAAPAVKGDQEVWDINVALDKGSEEFQDPTSPESRAVGFPEKHRHNCKLGF
jgi:hypothetical protein